MSELVNTEQIDHVLIISMRRESKGNAVDRDLADAIDAALNSLDDDPDLWVGILTGTPTMFSAGSDLNARGDYVTARGGEYGIVRRTRNKPLIAAVEGFALGGGLEIVLSCDLVVAAENARFGLPEVSIGVLPTCAALFRAPRSFPLNLAREMILTGEPISARRAHDAGFVNVISEPGHALDGALQLARRICSNAPLSVQASMRAINAYVGSDDDLGWEVTERAIASMSGTDDSKEGVRAFLEKRPPQWTGR